MTETKTQPLRLQAIPDSRLDQLLALYDELKAAAEQAEARFDEVNTAIKAELAGRVAQGRPVEVSHPALARPLRLTYVESWRIDSKGLKAADPATYVKWAKKSIAAKLARVQQP